MTEMPTIHIFEQTCFNRVQYRVMYMTNDRVFDTAIQVDFQTLETATAAVRGHYRRTHKTGSVAIKMMNGTKTEFRIEKWTPQAA